jgi:hypothetical protein
VTEIPKGFCIYCENHVIDFTKGKDPKKGLCKAKKGYTTHNALIKAACNDYQEMSDDCKSCHFRGQCSLDYNPVCGCWAFGQNWQKEERTLLEKQLGRRGAIVKEFNKLKGVLK